MPVRYDIAAGVPQEQGGGFDPMNAFAQMQAMSYRQQQNALAQMQMQEYARKLQAMQALRGISPNFEDPRFAQQTWQYDPETAMQVQNVIRQGAAQRATEEAQRAAAGYHTGMLSLARQKQQLETPEIMAKGRKEISAATGEDIKAAQRLVAPAFMARDPETFAARYAQVYPDLPASVQKRLGARPEMQDIEAFLSTPEEILQARKPISGVKSGETIVTPTGRPGEPAIAVEPEYRAPNAMVTGQPALNTFAQQGRMPPSADMTAPEVDPIIAKALRKDAMLKQLPPGPIRETAGARMDLRDTFDSMEASFGALADAGGIPRAGATNATNWKAAFKKSPTGQAIGGLTDSETNAQLAALRTQSAILKAQLRKGLEMGITQMDAVKEADKLDAAFLNPDKTKGLGEAYASIDALRKLMGGEAAAPATRGKVGGETKPLGGPIDFGDLK